MFPFFSNVLARPSRVQFSLFRFRRTALFGSSIASTKLLLICALSQQMGVFLAFASRNSLGRQLRSLFNDPFSNVHHYWNWFDAVLLTPYFIVMIVLALYGMHRYTLCYQYFKHRRNYNPNPPSRFAELPRVTVQLPIFNEQFVIDRLIEAVCAMEYPQGPAGDPGAGRLHGRDPAGGGGDCGALRGAWAPDRVHSSHQPARVQGGRAGCGSEGGQGRVRRHLRRRFCASAGLADERDPSFCRAGDRHGADALDSPEPRLQHADADRGHPAGRALRSGARRARAHGRVFQLQRHRRHVAAAGHYRCRRMAARYA